MMGDVGGHMTNDRHRTINVDRMVYRNVHREWERIGNGYDAGRRMMHRRRSTSASDDDLVTARFGVGGYDE